MAKLSESFLVGPRLQTAATPQSRGLNPKSILTPITAALTKHANPSADSGNPLGIGTLGDGRKPYKLGGG
jgi:hypothetical protein